MLQQIKNIARKQRHNDFFWRYGFNFRPSLNYKFDSHAAAGTAAELVKKLDRDGVAVTTIDALLAETSLFAELDATVEKMLADRRAELDELKRSANDPAIGEKTFNVELLGSEVDFDARDVFARFALQETFLDIANAYFGMRVKMRYYNVWQTFASEGAPRESQLWHFDREDNYILKAFLYLKDVDEGTGPFTYAPKTHRKGELWAKQPEFSLENGVMRSTDEQMAQIVPRENWVRGTGRKGTIIFADTRGFHKGGEARTDDRLMFTCMYTSPASDSKRLLKYRNYDGIESLTQKQRQALEIN